MQSEHPREGEGQGNIARLIDRNIEALVNRRRQESANTGLEEKVARDSGAVIIARRAGTVTRVTADEIIVDAGTNGATPAEQPLAR